MLNNRITTILVFSFTVLLPYSLFAREEPSVATLNNSKITISEHSWDFGSIRQGKKASRRFIIRNDGENILEITKIRPSCGCVRYEIPKKEIAPGKKVKLKVIFDSRGRKGKQHKRLYIHSNDLSLPVLALKITGNIEVPPRPVIQIRPIRHYLGKVGIGESPRREITIANRGERVLIIKKIEPSSGCTAKLLTSKEIPPGTEGHIEITLHPINAEQDKVDESVIIYSNDPDQPKAEMSIFGYMRKKPPLSIIWMYLFHSPDCDACERVIKDFIPGISKQYPLKISYKDAGDYNDYQLLLDLEKDYGSFGDKFPVVVIGEDVLKGEKEIKGQLEQKIKYYQSRGGVSLPGIRGLNPFAIERLTEPIYLALFTQPGCKGCARAKFMLMHLERRYPYLVIKTFDSKIKEDYEIQEAISELVGIPEHRRFFLPAVCIGRDYLIKEEITDANLVQLIEKYKDTGSRCLWEDAKSIQRKAHAKILDRFETLTLFTVISAGMLDGINPCAFATIIFFVSYLVFIKKKRKEIILAGASFTLAVFMTYLLSGLGAWRIIQSLGIFPFLSRCFYFIIIILTLILSGYSFYDYYLSKKGKVKEIKLQLPMFIKKRIHLVIREGMKTRDYIISAFIIGFFVSLLELVCTGQVYLPTITFAARTSEFGSQAIIYLIIYNLMFIIPLATVFFLTAYGIGSERLQILLKRNIGKTKLTLAIFFLLLALLLIFLIM